MFGSHTAESNEQGLHKPAGGCIDPFGNFLVCDQANSAIRRISPAGHMEIVGGRIGKTGKQDGKADQARFYWPASVCISPLPADVPVADPSLPAFPTFNFSQFLQTNLKSDQEEPYLPPVISPFLLQGFNIMVADEYNHVIRSIARDGVVSTIAGNGRVGCSDGKSYEAQFFDPKSLVVHPKTRTIYVSDCSNQSIRAVSAHGKVSTFVQWEAVDGQTHKPHGLAFDRDFNLYVADAAAHCIYRVSPKGEVSLFAGREFMSGYHDGPAKSALFSNPVDVCVDMHGNVLVCDRDNNRIRLIRDGVVSTLCGNEAGNVDGIHTQALLNAPTGVKYDHRLGGGLFISDMHSVRYLTFPAQLTHWHRRAPVLLARHFLSSNNDTFSSVGRSYSLAKRTLASYTALSESPSVLIPLAVPKPDHFAELLARLPTASSSSSSDASEDPYAIRVEDLIAEEAANAKAKPYVKHAEIICMLLPDAIFQRVVRFL